MSVLSDNIKLLRMKSGLKQAEIAQKVGITDKNWSSYERGKTEPPVDTLIKIANVFGLSVDGLINRDVSLIAKTLIEKNTANESLNESPNESLNSVNESKSNYEIARQNLKDDVVLVPFNRLNRLYELMSDIETRLTQLEQKQATQPKK